MNERGVRHAGRMHPPPRFALPPHPPASGKAVRSLLSVGACLFVLLAFHTLAAIASAQDIRFRDRVDVESVVVDARVVDGAGRPILGLTPRDFRLKVDGREVPLESVTWVAEATPPDPAATAAALQAGAPPLPRGRLIVFFFQKDLESSRVMGWGMGRWSPGGGVFLDHDYGPARRALVAGRVTVFALDITSADYHTLEVGLEQVAEDTGGFYAKTHLFPDQALARLEHALAGHYVLTFAKPDLPRGEHEIDVALVGRKGNVLARPSYEG
jgi:hypothetical protein